MWQYVAIRKKTMQLKRKANIKLAFAHMPAMELRTYYRSRVPDVSEPSVKQAYAHIPDGDVPSVLSLRPCFQTRGKPSMKQAYAHISSMKFRTYYNVRAHARRVRLATASPHACWGASPRSGTIARARATVPWGLACARAPAGVLLRALRARSGAYAPSWV